MNHIPKYLEQLRELLPKLYAGEIFAIEFGNPQMPQGLQSHHCIQYVNKGGVPQICFKMIVNGALSSGIYLGSKVTERDIEIRAQHHLEMYFRPTATQRLVAASSNADKLTKQLCYFAVTD